MDSDAATVLAEIHRLLTPHEEIVGRLALQQDRLVTEIGGRPIFITTLMRHDEGTHPSIAHVHVMVETDAGHLSGNLDACVLGVNSNRAEACKDAAKSWCDLVAGPVFSLFHAKPVLRAEHFDGTEPWSLPGVHGFVGPLITRIASPDFKSDELLAEPMFTYAQEIAPPGNIHLAKSVLTINGGKWSRTLEVDGHKACYVDDAWSTRVSPPKQIVASRFATFHYADQPSKVTEREQLDSAIRAYVKSLHVHQDFDKVEEELRQMNVPSAIMSRIYTFITLAFGRHVLLNQMPVKKPSTFHRVLLSGEVELDVPLMSQPTFARSLILAQELADNGYHEILEQLALRSAEVGVLNDLLHKGSKLQHAQILPIVVPDEGVSEEQTQQAFRKIYGEQFRRPQETKPWWKFW